MKILIELPTWLGDAIMTSPAIENLSDFFTNSNITLIGPLVSIDALKNHPNVVNTIFLDKNYSHLLRIAVNNKIISISLRKRITPKSKFSLQFINYKRTKPEFKNLKYKKIIKYLSKIDTSSSDVGLYNNKKILETATCNILFVSNNKIYSPIKNFYKGITLHFFEKRIKKITKKNISIDSLKFYDEIILIGSGKGIISVDYIKKPYWRRKSSKIYRFLSKIYRNPVTNCPRYNG